MGAGIPGAALAASGLALVSDLHALRVSHCTLHLQIQDSNTAPPSCPMSSSLSEQDNDFSPWHMQTWGWLGTSSGSGSGQNNAALLLVENKFQIPRGWLAGQGSGMPAPGPGAREQPAAEPGK